MGEKRIQNYNEILKKKAATKYCCFFCCYLLLLSQADVKHSRRVRLSWVRLKERDKNRNNNNALSSKFHYIPG